MIAARLTNNEEGEIILIILEPGNIEKLKRGEPIHKFLNEFMPELSTKVQLMFAYTPDADWVSKQCGKGSDSSRLADVLKESLSRPEVVRDSRSSEEMRKRTV